MNESTPLNGFIEKFGVKETNIVFLFLKRKMI